MRTDRPSGPLLLVLALAAAAPSGAVELRPADIVVTDAATGIVYRVDPATGDASVVSSAAVGSGPLMGMPISVGIAPDGSLLVGDQDLDPALFRVDPATGDRSVVSDATRGTGPVVTGPTSVVVEPGGESAVVTDFARLLRVDLATGDRTIVSNANVGTGPPLGFPLRVAPDPDGSLWVTTGELFGQGGPGVFRVDPATGDRTLLTDAVSGEIAVEPDGNLLVGGYEVYRADASTGATAFVVDLDPLSQLYTIGRYAVEADGSLLVPAIPMFGAPGVLIRVDPSDGESEFVAAGSFENPQGIAVVPSAPPVPAAPAALRALAAALLMLAAVRRRLLHLRKEVASPGIDR